MGLFDEVFDAIIDLPVQIISAPAKAIDRLVCFNDHNMVEWRRLGKLTILKCTNCDKQEKVMS